MLIRHCGRGCTQSFRLRGLGETEFLTSPRTRPAHEGHIIAFKTCSQLGCRTGNAGASIGILTRRLSHAAQPKYDLVYYFRCRQEAPFISDKSAAGQLRSDDGVTSNTDSSAGGASLGDIGTLLSNYVSPGCRALYLYVDKQSNTRSVY